MLLPFDGEERKRTRDIQLRRGKRFPQGLEKKGRGAGQRAREGKDDPHGHTPRWVKGKGTVRKGSQARKRRESSRPKSFRYFETAGRRESAKGMGSRKRGRKNALAAARGEKFPGEGKRGGAHNPARRDASDQRSVVRGKVGGKEATEFSISASPCEREEKNHVS